MAVEVGQLFVSLSMQIAKFEKDMNKATRVLEKRLSRINSSFAKVAKLTNLFRVALLGLGAATVIFGIQRLTAAIVKTSGAFELLKVRVDNVTGSIRQTNKDMSQLEKIARSTGFNIFDLADSYAKLGVVGLDSLRVLRATVDAVAAVGGGTVELEGVVRAFFQTASKANVSLEELNQIGERGIPAVRILKDELNLTRKELRDLTAAGISSKQAIDALVDGMEKRFGGAAKDLSTTVIVLFRRLNQEWELFKKSIGEKGLLDTLRGGLQDVLDILNKLRDDGTLDRLANKISKVLSLFSNLLVTAFEFIAGSADEGSERVASFKNLISSIADTFKGFITTFKNSFLNVLDFIFSYMRKQLLILAEEFKFEIFLALKLEGKAIDSAKRQRELEDIQVTGGTRQGLSTFNFEKLTTALKQFAEAGKKEFEREPGAGVKPLEDDIEISDAVKSFKLGGILTQTLKESITDAFDFFKDNVLTKTFADTGITESFNTGSTGIKATWEGIKNLGSNFVDNFSKAMDNGGPTGLIVEVIKQLAKLVGIMDIISMVLEAIAKLFKPFSDIMIEYIGEPLVMIVDALQPIMEIIVRLFAPILKAMGGYIALMAFMIEIVAEFLLGVFDPLLDIFDDINRAFGAVSCFFDNFRELFDKIWGWIQAFFTLSNWTGLLDYLVAPLVFWLKLIGDILGVDTEDVGEAIENLPEAIEEVGKQTVENFEEATSDLAEGKGDLGNLITFSTGGFITGEGVGNAADAVESAFIGGGGSLNNVLAEALASQFVKLFNNREDPQQRALLTEVLNNEEKRQYIKRGLLDAGLETQLPSINTVLEGLGIIPLAKGGITSGFGQGVFTTPTLNDDQSAMLSEFSQPEAVLPLTRMSDGNLGVQTSGAGGSAPQSITIQVDGRTFGQWLLDGTKNGSILLSNRGIVAV